MKKFTSPFKLIQEAFEIFSKKENVISFIKIYSPLAALSLISLLFIYVPFADNFFKTSPGGIVMNFFNAIYALVGVLVNLAGIMSISKILKKEKVVFDKVYKESFSRYGSFLLLTIIVSLIYGVSFILLIVPFIFTITWFTFSRFLNVDKKLGIKAALAESKRLVKGNFWKVFSRIVVFALFAGVSQIITSTLPYGTGVIIYDLCGALFVLPFFLFYKEISS